MTLIKHRCKISGDKLVYLCNQAIKANPQKLTANLSDITCKNCLKITEKELKC